MFEHSLINSVIKIKNQADLISFRSSLFFSFEYPLIPLFFATSLSSASFIVSINGAFSSFSVISSKAISLFDTGSLPLGPKAEGRLIGDLLAKLDGGRATFTRFSGCSFARVSPTVSEVDYIN